jgi:hypothetical protein
MESPVPSSWEAQIDERRRLAKYCLATDAFTAYDTIIASDILAEVDHFQTFELAAGTDAGKQTAETLKQINAKTVQRGGENYDIFSKKVESLKQQRPNKEEWEKTIDLAADEAKKRSNKLIDDAANSAKAVIRKLPDNARAPAAGVFKKGLNGVMTFFQTAWASIKKVVEAIADFIRGIWRKLKEAWETVKRAAKSAIDWITGIFSLASAEALWPSDYPASKVNKELGLLLEDLGRQGLEVGDLSVQKSTKGWVVQTSLNPTDDEGISDGVEAVWDRAVTSRTAAISNGSTW